MKVLIWKHDGAVEGGHAVQARKTCAALKDLGVNVQQEEGPNVVTTGYDVIHGFGIPASAIRRCRVEGRKVALSSIYWSRRETEGYRPLRHRGVLKSRVKRAIRMAESALKNEDMEWADRRLAPWFNKTLEFESADVLLPNSLLEAECIRRELRVTTPQHVVPNAVDLNRVWESAGSNANRECILSVGRIEPHKNQLGIIRALRNSSYRVIFAGYSHPDHQSYLDKCRREMTSSMEILVSPTDEELKTAYGRAKLHILASRFETTGLVSLEAAVSGCNIVTTTSGFAKEYFGDAAWYCQWDNIDSIRSAVDAAYRADTIDSLKQHVLQHFTWNATARETLTAYQRLLSNEVFPEPVALAAARRGSASTTRHDVSQELQPVA